jgi:hypothetical protein
MSKSFNPSEWITTSEATQLTGYTARYFRKALVGMSAITVHTFRR